jgi:BirA family biotin operon repressor/biotin-[acetyl-CoA-carboxylase] ligase
MTVLTDLDILKNLAFFSVFDEGELSYLLAYIEKEEFGKGDTVIEAGSKGRNVSFLVSGKVSVKKTLSLNLEYLGYKPLTIVEPLGTFGPGYYFGELALLGNFERSADVIADEDCELISISKSSFDTIIGENAGIGQKMLLAFCKNLASWITTYDKKLIENAQHRTLIELLKTEKKKIAAMHKITRSTVFSTVAQVLDTILEACMDCLNVEKGSVMIFKDGFLHVDAAFGLDKFEISGKVQEITEGSVSGRCFITGKPILLDDINTVEGLHSAGDGKKYYNGSVLSVPLVSLKGESIGVLNVSNKTSREIFNGEDSKLLQDLGQEAAAMLGYEIDRLKKEAKTVVSSDRIASSIKASFPSDMSSLGEFIDKTREYKIIYEDFVRSTNDIAGEYVRKGYGHGTVVIANGQSSGRGRSGKAWFSPPGFNIYMSIVVTRSLQKLGEKISLINLAASLSVAEAIRKHTGLDVWPKWPNDIYCSGKQIGGILSESVIRGSTLYGFLTGIGINVNQEIFPDNLKGVFTSVFLEKGKKVNRGDLVIEVLKRFTYHYEMLLKNSKTVISDWMALSKTLNASVRAFTGKEEFRGKAIGLNDHGMLMIELPDKNVITLASGEIFHDSEE